MVISVFDTYPLFAARLLSLNLAAAAALIRGSVNAGGISIGGGGVGGGGAGTGAAPPADCAGPCRHSG